MMQRNKTIGLRRDKLNQKDICWEVKYTVDGLLIGVKIGKEKMYKITPINTTS